MKSIVFCKDKEGEFYGDKIFEKISCLSEFNFLNHKEIFFESDSCPGNRSEFLIRESFRTYERNIFFNKKDSYVFCVLNSFLDNFKVEDNFLIIFDSDFETKEISQIISSGIEGRNIILVGLRDISKEKAEYFKSKGVKFFLVDFVEDFEILCDSLMEYSNGKNVFVLFNFSVIDPVFFKDSSKISSGGFSSREILYFSRRLSLLKNLKVVSFFGSKSDFIEDVSFSLAYRIVKNFLN